MTHRPVAAAAASMILLAALALISLSIHGPSRDTMPPRPTELDSADNQPIFSVSSDINPNAGWNDPYAKDGVLKRASGLDDVLGHEGYLNDHRAINEDSVPTYDNIVQGQFNHKIHLPFHSLVAQVSRFRLPPASTAKARIAIANVHRNAAASAGVAAGNRSLAVKAKPLTALQRKAAAIAAAKAAAQARLYRRLWQEQGSDFTSFARGSKVCER
jgi:hypothetical protein